MGIQGQCIMMGFNPLPQNKKKSVSPAMPSKAGGFAPPVPTFAVGVQPVHQTTSQAASVPLAKPTEPVLTPDDFQPIDVHATEASDASPVLYAVEDPYSIQQTLHEEDRNPVFAPVPEPVMQKQEVAREFIDEPHMVENALQLQGGPHFSTPQHEVTAFQDNPDASASQRTHPADVAVVGLRIGDILIRKGFVSQEQLKKALTESRATGGTLGSILTRVGAITDEQLGMCLAELHGLEYIRAKDINLKPEVIDLLPSEFIKQHLAVPHRIDSEQERLEVIIAHPDKTRIIDDIALMTRYRVIAKVCTRSELSQVIDKYFSLSYAADEVLEALEVDVAQNNKGDDETSLVTDDVNADSAPVVQFVNGLLNDAIERNTSDIHIEPQPQRLLVRLRIDGILIEAQSLGPKVAPAVVSRIKVMANMDISERRRPQDGRIKHRVGSSSIDMRVNTIPAQFGEKVVIRILKGNSGSSQITNLGLSRQDASMLHRMIRAPHGIILVTGPTGSGKTTTLYAALRDIATSERNISTIEDPIEYVLPGINQMQVQHRAGLTFATCLRALLRQDPDVIMVGEIRDKETLEAAFHAAMTGHLVFSTIHTNSCAKTVARLLDMGAPPYLVSTSIVGVMAQRLVRSLCPHCKEPVSTMTDEDRELLNRDDTDLLGLNLHRAVGCDLCNNTGYKGRRGLYEILPIDRDIARLIDENASTVQIEDVAIRKGMTTLLDDARRLVMEGATTTQEVRRTLGYGVGS
jgi:type IV pilus assembly protein PilB